MRNLFAVILIFQQNLSEIHAKSSQAKFSFQHITDYRILYACQSWFMRFPGDNLVVSVMFLYLYFYQDERF